MKELDLKELELQEQALAELPELRNELIETIEAMQQRLRMRFAMLKRISPQKQVTVQTQMLYQMRRMLLGFIGNDCDLAVACAQARK